MDGITPLPHIRAARLDDVAALVVLARETFCDTFAHLYAPNDLATYLASAYSVAAFERMVMDEATACHIAEADDGRLLGFCVTVQNLAIDYDPRPRRALELSKLYLRTEAQGTGLADAFMAWAESAARRSGFDEIAMSVYCDNIRAQKFYQRHGYAKFADSFFMVGNHRDDEYLYRKDLTPRG